MRKKRAGVLLALALSALFFAVVPADAYAARCFQNFVMQASDCVDVIGFWTRTACFLDAELELAGCIRRTI